MVAKRSGQADTVQVDGQDIVVIEGATCAWPRRKEIGNIGKVRAALRDITGNEPIERSDGPDRFMLMSRMNREFDTVDSLRRNSYRAYWPNYPVLKGTRERQSGRVVRRIIRVGIIPGYVFSEADPKRDLIGNLDRIVGAIDVVWSFAGEPLMIRDDDIQIIRRIEIGLNLPRPKKVEHDFKTGERVRFVDDLLSIWPPGRIEKLASDGRIIVEVELMGQKVPVTALPNQIERTQASPSAKRIPAQSPPTARS